MLSRPTTASACCNSWSNAVARAGSSLPRCQFSKNSSYVGNVQAISQIAITVKPNGRSGWYLDPALNVAAITVGGHMCGKSFTSGKQTNNSDVNGISGYVNGSSYN
jgi:hypothetical protein